MEFTVLLGYDNCLNRIVFASNPVNFDVKKIAFNFFLKIRFLREMLQKICNFARLYSVLYTCISFLKVGWIDDELA